MKPSFISQNQHYFKFSLNSKSQDAKITLNGAFKNSESSYRHSLVTDRLHTMWHTMWCDTRKSEREELIGNKMILWEYSLSRDHKNEGMVQL